MPELTANPQVNRQPNPEPTLSSGPVKGGRNYISIIIGVLAVAVVLLTIWIGYQALNTGPAPSTSPITTINKNDTVSEIKSDSDFQKLEDDINNQNIDGLTKDLDQNDTDAAGF